MIAFSDMFVNFATMGGVVIGQDPPDDDHGGAVLRWAGSTYLVQHSAGGYGLTYGSRTGYAEARDADLVVVEKILAMRIGPIVRRRLGLPPEGFLPDIFTLAPGVAWVNTGSGMRLSWREDGDGQALISQDGSAVDSLHTYRSQYLRFPLHTIIRSFTQEGQGIFTDQAPGAPRPFTLPPRTHDWVIRTWPEHRQVAQSAFYEESTSGGLRICVVNGGYRIDRRGERSNRYPTFEMWAASLEVLQVYLTWECRFSWSPGFRQRRFLRVPGADVLAAGFTVEPDTGENGRVRLLLDGQVQAVVWPASPHRNRPAELSQLLAIGLDMLELSILDVDGAPALTTG